MSYAKKIGTATLYQGTSFSISVGKETGDVWASTEDGEFEVTDEENTVVLSGDLVKSGDNLSLTAIIGRTDCVDWVGNYKLLAYQTDTGDSEIRVPIVDYDLDYETTKAD